MKIYYIHRLEALGREHDGVRLIDGVWRLATTRYDFGSRAIRARNRKDALDLFATDRAASRADAPR